MSSLDQHGGGHTAAAVLRHLIDRALLTPADAVDGGFTAVDSSMSHESLLVRVGGEPRYFAKRADAIRSGGRSLHVEADFYSRLATLATIRELVPRCRLIAATGESIVMDAPNAAPLDVATLLCAGGAAHGDRARAIVRRYGTCVARVHAVGALPRLGPAPWILQMLEAPPIGSEWAPAPSRRLVRRMNADPAYRAAFREARRRWSPTGLVHGDLRAANVLVERDAPAPRVWLVDWELACFGDRAWDVAALVAELIAIALIWDPRPQPCVAVRESAAVLFGAYRGEWGAPDDDWTALVRRAVPFAGIKLVQTLLEIGYGDEQAYARAEQVLLPWVDELLASSPSLVADLAVVATSATT